MTDVDPRATVAVDELLAGLASSDVPSAMVLVDAAGGLRLVTNAARAILMADPADRGLARADPTLAAEVAEVLASGTPADKDISASRVSEDALRKRLRRRIDPCRSAGGAIVGACVTYREDDRAQVAHDLRSPLTAIAMWAKFMRSRPMNEAERAQGLDTILRSVGALQSQLDRFAEG